MNDWVIHTKIDITGYKKTLNGIVNNIPPSLKKYRSTKGFNSKQYLLHEYQDKFLKIQEDVKIQIKTHANIKNNLNLIAAWTVLGYEDSYHVVHKHNEPTNHVASVLYLKVPKPTINKGGQFYFFIRDKNSNITYHEIKPKEGSLIIMPIHIFHGAYPQARGLRQTLNMDFEIEKLC